MLRGRVEEKKGRKTGVCLELIRGVVASARDTDSQSQGIEFPCHAHADAEAQELSA